MTKRTIPNAAALTGWRKSSYSSGDGGSCVEILDNYPSGIPVRDSKTPDGPAMVVPEVAWLTFVATIKDYRPLPDTPRVNQQVRDKTMLEVA
ncbi:DUF397 domain-containing protein [Streptomyces sp. TP-A0874]|uniref:DUF397 domain-containing protein n=1 Tax=Streptomyces sp. TP-A0874 TaxID=549819 RepID=UPI00099FE08D|nr:DUF397 domain-containing protein [Streptomyces sp. TP-A0874]